MNRTRLATLLLLLAASATVILAGAWRPDPALAQTNLLLNPTFDAGNTNEWYGSGGTIGASAPAHSGSYSMYISGASQVNVIQNIDSSAIVGRNLSVSGWIYSDVDRGVSIGVDITVPTTSQTICSITVPASTSTWSYFSTTCTVPQMIYSINSTPRFRITSPGSASNVRIDDLSITASGDAPPFAINKQNVTLGTLSPSHQIIGFNASAPDYTKGELQVMDADGTNVTRITYDGATRKWFHAAISSDRTMIVADSYVDCGFGGNTTCSAMEDPQTVWVIDLVHGQQWQILPSWLNTGQGGVDWSPDSQWIFISIGSGRYNSIYKIRPDGTDLTFVGPPNMDWASDVALSKDGEWIVYKHSTRAANGQLLGRGGIGIMKIDGSANQVVSSPPVGSCPGWPVDDYDPEWSPDRTQIVFSTADPTNGCKWTVNRVNVSTLARNTVFAGSISAWIPDWNESGILMTESGGGYYGAAMIQPDGSNETRIGPNINGHSRFIHPALASTPTPTPTITPTNTPTPSNTPAGTPPVGGVSDFTGGGSSGPNSTILIAASLLLLVPAGAWIYRIRQRGTR